MYNIRLVAMEIIDDDFAETQKKKKRTTSAVFGAVR